MRKAILLAVALLLSAACTGVAYAQSAAFATITGRVLDPKGATVPDIAVTATNAETGLVRATKTTAEGLYRFDNLAPGIYNVTVEAAGFAKAEANSIKLQVGEQRDVNFALELAGQKQTVVVTSEVPLVEATKTDVSTVVDDKAVADLPTTTSFAGIGGVANDYEGLAASAPGVRYDYTGLSFDIVGPGAVNSRGITVNLDGGNISDQVVSSRDALGASVEEVKEFQVLSNNYNAEYGQAGNVVLNVITKSGTNQIHGDWHSYFRGRNMGASDWFYNTGFAGATAPPQANNTQGCPLSDFNSAGDLTSISGCPRAPFFKHENGFTAGGPLKKDRLFWFGSWEKVAQGAPSTTTPFGSSVTVNSGTNEILGSGKIDAKLSEKHLLTIRYNLQRDVSGNLLVQTGPNTDPSGFVASVVHDNGLNIGMVSTLTAHTVNEARFYWHRFLSQTPDASTIPGETLPTAYVGADFCCPQGALQHRFQYIDNFSYTRGTHTLKMGADISHFPYDSIFQQYHYGVYSNFAGGGCQNTLFTNTAAQNLCPSQFTFGSGPGFVQSTDNIYGAYIQDAWQIRPNLTMNYGLRYDIEVGAFKGGTVVNPTVPGSGCFQSNGLIPACGSDKNNWQPRLGIAWSPNYSSGFLHTIFGDQGKSVIRAAGAVVTEMAYLNVVLDSLNFDGKNLNTTAISFPALQTTSGQQTGCFLPNGSPNPNSGNPQACAVLTAYPNTPSATALLPFTTGSGFFGRIRPISPTIKNPNIYMGSLSITRQIGPSFVWSIGYQGVFGHGLYGETDTNFPVPVADPNHPGYFYYRSTGISVANNETDRPDPFFGAIRTNFSNRSSGYNGVYVTAEKRVSHHTQFQASYTFSKTLGNGEDFFGLSEPANPFAPLSAETALSQQDIRHLVNFNFVVDTKNLFHTPIINHMFNNWTFGTLGTMQSGRPYPVSTGDGSFTGSAFPALGSETNQRPNVLPDGTLVTSGIGSISGTNVLISEADVANCMAIGYSNCGAIQTTWLAPAGASLNGPIDSYTGQPVDFKYISGNLARNLGLTSALYRFDVSLMKSFQIPKWESSSLELKLDVFNVFNTPLFIFNDANNVLSFFSGPNGLPSMGTPPTSTTPAIPNPNFNCTAACINPFTGFYLGNDGKALNIKDFRGVSVDKAQNMLGLGAPAGVVEPRIMQVSVRFVF